MFRLLSPLAPLLLASTLAAQPSTPVTNDLFTPTTSGPRLVIPVAGAIAGSNGTFFRSDINVINFRNADQRVEMHWLPQGSSGDSVPDRTLNVGARSGFSSEDFVTNVLNQSGLGAIEIIAVTADGTPDPNGQLHATSRIWTPRPDGASGTLSQTFPALIVQNVANNIKWIFGVRRDADRYRLNAGVMNNATVAQRFRITTVGSQTGAGESTEIDVPARAIQQINLPGTSNGTFQVIVQNISTNGIGTSWQAWASSVDNITGDAWSQVAFPAPSTAP
ncbi:MAG: hypothetical protein QOH21_1563 [Acidobacteriota bacterium]|nr:hypothetical protein [Acidobacteriota bacterium]